MIRVLVLLIVFGLSIPAHSAETFTFGPTPDFHTSATLFDEFISRTCGQENSYCPTGAIETNGQIGQLFWIIQGTDQPSQTSLTLTKCKIISTITGDPSPSQLRLEAVSVGAQYGCILILPGKNNYTNAGSYTIQATWRVQATSAGDTLSGFRAGIASGPDVQSYAGFVAGPNNGIYLETLPTDGATPNWFCVSKHTVSQTRVDTGIAVGSGPNLFDTLSISIKPGTASTQQCTVNGVTVTSSGTAVNPDYGNPFVSIFDSAALGDSGTNLVVDYFYSKITGITR